MEGSAFDEAGFFRNIVVSGVRALLIGRRALNVAVEPHGLIPNRTVDDLILTKRFAARAKDLEDLNLLEALRIEEGQR
jgi:hypothetical protein